MISVLLLLSCTIVIVLSTQPVVSLHLCKTDNDVCVTNAVKAAYPLILEPNENIGAKDMDPLYQEIIEGNLSTLKFKFLNNTVIGFKTCEVQTAKFVDNNEDILRIDLLCPKFKLHGLYVIKGQLITIPIEGNGNYVLDTKKYSITVDLELKTITKHGKSYKSVKGFKTKAEALEKVTYDLRNLFNGRQDLAEVVLKFANEHWKEVANDVQYPVLTADIKKIVKNANAYLKTIPIDEYMVQ
ncbi:unnamed protein product [Arctia plantaginis]|uniref:Circadian clock-controlled protein-like n=1 Tax=Arctia plantaginis TaxID=874455 RepID=A0A8S1BDB7_ARCPL|nr:unnamed protein product [Arctia plantaginis]